MPFYQVSVYSDNGTTYFYNPDEQLSSQLATGGVRSKYLNPLAVENVFMLS